MFKYTASTPTKASIYITRHLTKSRYTTTTSLRMAQPQQNAYGQGVSHAVGDSVVPEAVQKAVPKGVEEALPNAIHDTGVENDASIGQTHAKDGGDASVVPKGIQKAVPEAVERALPNAVHDTGDKK